MQSQGPYKREAGGLKWGKANDDKNKEKGGDNRSRVEYLKMLCWGIWSWKKGPWIKECRHPLEVQKTQDNVFSRASRRNTVLLTKFRLLNLKNNCYSSHYICGNLLQQPQESNAPTMARNFPKCLRYINEQNKGLCPNGA